ncbi:MAG: hypothetical protein FJ290_14850 [Planctomycetes bacterium]|nr:hypothetical protein [Planctomycetota bacterium]
MHTHDRGRFAHDWVDTGHLIPRCDYETKHRSYRCRLCGARAGRHYLSHRHGWQPTKLWHTECPARRLGPLFDGPPPKPERTAP